jgi:hypothetical protein
MPNWTPEQVAAVLTAAGTLVAALAAVVSALFAILAVRTQRAAQRPHVRVRHTTPMPVWQPMPGSFQGSKLGDPWFVVTVHNDGLLPVTVNSAGLAFGSEGSAPFLGPPSALGGVGDRLPKRLEPGEEAALYLDPLRMIAVAHAEHGGAKWVTATLAGGQEFHGPRIKKAWLDGWLPKPGS